MLGSMRILALAIAGAASCGSGCVTYFVQGAIGQSNPTTRFGALTSAYIVDARADGEVEVLAMVDGNVLHTPAMTWGCNLPMPTDALILRMQVDPAAGSLEIVEVRPPSDPRYPPSGPGVVALPRVDDRAPEQPARLGFLDRAIVLEGRTCAVPGSYQRDPAPVILGHAVTLPVTVAVDVALVPVYALAAGGFALYDVLD